MTQSSNDVAVAELPPSEEQLWWSVRETVRSVLLPQLGDPWARLAAIQLVGPGRLRPPTRRRRPVARTPERAAHRARPGRHGDHGRGARRRVGSSRRRRCRPAPRCGRCSSRYLDEDMVLSAPLIGAFRGQLPEGDPPPHTPSFHQAVELAADGGARARSGGHDPGCVAGVASWAARSASPGSHASPRATHAPCSPSPSKAGRATSSAWSRAACSARPRPRSSG